MTDQLPSWEDPILSKELTKNVLVGKAMGDQPDGDEATEGEELPQDETTVDQGEIPASGDHGKPTVEEMEQNPERFNYGIHLPDEYLEDPPADDDPAIEDTPPLPKAGEEDLSGTGEGSAGNRLNNPWVRGTGILVLVASIGLGGYFLLQPPPDPVQSVTQNIPPLDDTPGGNIEQTSRNYQETLIDHNDAGADEAVETGQSFVATVESHAESFSLDDPSPEGNETIPVFSVAEPQTDMGEEAVPESPEIAIPIAGSNPTTPDPDRDYQSTFAVNESEVGAQDSDADPVEPIAPSYFFGDETSPQPDALLTIQDNPYLATLEELTRIPLPSMGSGSFITPSEPEGSLPSPFPSTGGNSFLQPVTPLAGSTITSATGVAPNAGHSIGEDPPAGLAPIGIPAGTVLHAEMVNGLNSDVQSPAVVTLVEGELIGSRLIGDFTPHAEAGGLALHFHTITTPDGESQAVTAYGLSPWTGEALTRSLLRPRLLERFGPTLLLGMLSGAGQLMAEEGTRIVVVGDAVYEERTGKISDRQLIAAGITNFAGQVVGSIPTPTGPQVLLYPGSPIAVLFATPVRETVH